MVTVPERSDETLNAAFTEHGLDIVGDDGGAFGPKRGNAAALVSIPSDRFLSTEAGQTLVNPKQAA
jgi:hypothetical protein